jgi:hypothetical protein
MKPLLLILLLSLPFSAQSQITWDQYKRRTQITVGAINIAYFVYNDKKQYIPLKTQKWLNWCAFAPTIGVTVYKTIEWKHLQKPKNWYKYKNRKKI